MGIFHDMVEVVNRTSKPLMVVYDGQRVYLKPNYTETGERIEGVINVVPRQVLPFALAQNPLMGSEDPIDPSSFKSLLGTTDPSEKKKSWSNCEFIGQPAVNAVPSRVDLKELLADDPTVKDIKLVGRPTKVEASTTEPFNIRPR